MPDVFSKSIPELLASHHEHLTASGISDDVIKARGYKSILTGKQLEPLGFTRSQRRAPGILIPIYGPDGSPGDPVYRPDNPRELQGKAVKYESIPLGSLRLDVNPVNKDHRHDPGVELWITEGAKKADALASRGAYAINLNGVWGFKGRTKLGGTALLADFDLIAWQGRSVYLVFDSDVTTKPQVKDALERLKEHLKRKNAVGKIVLLPGELNGHQQKVGVDDYLAAGHSIDELKEHLLDDGIQLELLHKEEIELEHDTYKVIADRICMKRRGPLVSGWIPLCNFVAEITNQTIIDDGIEESRMLDISGSINGEPLPPLQVPLNSFAGMDWPLKEWGPGVIIRAGTSSKDNLRAAIQMMSHLPAKPMRVYAHTGWRDIEGEHLFLGGAGAVGREGINVVLQGNLARYNLPVDVSQGPSAEESVRTSLEFLNISNPEVTWPLWAAMYLSPLAELLEPAFTLWVLGRSGGFKSTLTALALCHFGHFTDSNMPITWEATANFLEKAMAILKDHPLVIDDYPPGANRAAAREQDAKVERIIRSQGNRSGRGRLQSDTQFRSIYIPRGMLVTSGEQLPVGESWTARVFVCEAEENECRVELLTAAQEKSDAYRYAMAHYIVWLQRVWRSLESNLRPDWESWRVKAISPGMHTRLPSSIAWLYVAFELAMRYAEEIGAITSDEFRENCDKAWETFMALGQRQGSRVEEERPAVLFIEALKTLLYQQKVITLHTGHDENEGFFKKPGQEFIGWHDEDFYYLEPRAAYAEVYAFYQRAGRAFTIRDSAVWGDLARLNYLELGIENRDGKKVQRKSVKLPVVLNGNRPRVLWLKKSVLGEGIWHGM
jgi:hypothetical protein